MAEHFFESGPAQPAEPPLQHLFQGFSNFMHRLENNLTGQGGDNSAPDKNAAADSVNKGQDHPQSQKGHSTVAEKSHNGGSKSKDGGAAREANKNVVEVPASPAAPKEAHLPLPPRRPPDLGKAPDQAALAEKTLRAIAKADGSTMAQPSREAQDAVKQFLEAKSHVANKDRQAVLDNLAPAFDKAMRSADGAYVKAEAEAGPGMKMAREGYIAANSNYNQTYVDTMTATATLAPADRQKAIAMLQEVGFLGTELPDEKELSKTFKNSPDFLRSLLQLSQDQKGVFAASRKLDDANKPVMDAALEQDRTRLAYERAAQSIGNMDLARSIDRERRLLAEHTLDITSTPEEVRRVLKI